MYNNQKNNDSPPLLRFEEPRNSPLLPGDSADYYVSILRLSAQTGDEIPLFISRIEAGQTQMDINKTIYRATVEHEGTSKTVPLIWDPSDLSAEAPQAPVLKQNIMIRCYYLTNFGQFAPMMNKALKGAWAVTRSTTNNSPFIDFDLDTCNFNLTADADWIEKVAKIHFNSRLYELLSNFPGKFVEYFGDKNNKIDIYNKIQPTYQTDIQTFSLW